MNTKRRAVLAPIHPPDGLRDELRNVHGKTGWREWAAKRCLELLVLDTFPPASPTPDPGLIMVYLEDDDREVFEGVYGDEWRGSVAVSALGHLVTIADEYRQLAEDARVKSILAQLGPDDVEAVKARLAELQETRGPWSPERLAELRKGGTFFCAWCLAAGDSDVNPEHVGEAAHFDELGKPLCEACASDGGDVPWPSVAGTSVAGTGRRWPRRHTVGEVFLRSGRESC